MLQTARCLRNVVLGLVLLILCLVSSSWGSDLVSCSQHIENQLILGVKCSVLSAKDVVG